jgi:lipopolysaccharide heptosyltransferase II
VVLAGQSNDSRGQRYGDNGDRKKPLIPMDNPQSILIIQLKRAGDVILTTPISTLLKRQFPQARIDFLVEKPFAPLLENHPAIDTIQVYDKHRIWNTLKNIRAQHYDWILDFQSSPRSALVTLASGALRTAGYRVPFWGRVYRQTVRRPDGSQTVIRGKVSLVESFIGPVTDIPAPQIYLTPEEQRWAEHLEPNARGRKWVGVVPTHRRSSRRWDAESFAALAAKLDQAGYQVWLFWGPGEREYVARLQKNIPSAQLIPETSLRQMAALLARCLLVVSNDNGPMHIAVAVGAPTVTIYGPTDPHSWNLGGPRHLALQAADVSCLGCNLNECPFQHECMTHVTPSQVFVASESLLTHAQKELVV